MLKYPVIALLALALSGFCIPAPAQEVKDAHEAEVKSQVPALQKFHEPIYKLWHTAWPKKDTVMMASLVADFDKGVAEVAAAELPGILREKKAAWEEGVKALQAAVTAYKAAIAAPGLQPKLDAAERLHMQYEKLVRLIRPVLKEMDAFHQVLYMIYHYYLPEHKTEQLQTAVTELSARMDTLDAARLPERLAPKEAAFQSARKKLSASVAYAKGVMGTKDEKKISEAIRRMHSDYESLEKVFE
jgi:hypothetical protein